MPARFRCAVCRHWCNPVDDDGWICDKRGGCGAEWPEEDDVRTRFESLGEHMNRVDAGQLERVKALLIDTIKDSKTPHALSVSLYEGWGLEVVGKTFTDKFGVQPVLVIVAASDGAREYEYFKQFNPLTGHEAHGEWIDEAIVEERLGQFSEGEQATIDHMFRYVDGRDQDRHWRYKRFARRSDF